MKDNDSLIELKETIDYLFPAHIKSVYELTSLALDLHSLDLNLKSLENIKQQLVNTNSTPEVLRPLDTTITDLKDQKSKVRTEMNQTEETGIQGLLEITHNLGVYTNGIRRLVSSRIPQLSNTVCKTVDEKTKAIHEALNVLKEETLNKSSGTVIRQSIENFKKETLEFHKRNTEKIAENNQKLFQDVVKRLKHILESIEKEKIVAHIVSSVGRGIDDKVRKNLKIDRQDLDPKTVLEILDKGIKKSLSPENIFPLVSDAPQFTLLQDLLGEGSVSNEAWIKDIPQLISLKSSIIAVDKELLSIKQKTEETRSLVDAARLGYIDPTTNVAQSASESNIERIYNRTVIMKKNVQMINTSLSTKHESIMGNYMSRKRKKLNHSDQGVMSKIKEIEDKHQNVLDFILKRKDLILGDTFPNDLNDTMCKIEEVLENHSMFLSFMLDPISTIEKRTSIPVVSEQDHLSQPMIDYIQQIIKKATNEATAPLREQIKSLQDQLNEK